MASSDQNPAVQLVDLEAPAPDDASKARVLAELSEDARLDASKYLREAEVPEGGE